MSEYHNARVAHNRRQELAGKAERASQLRTERADVKEAKQAPEEFSEYVLSRVARFAFVCNSLIKRNIQDFGNNNTKTKALRDELYRANSELVPSEIKGALKKEYERAARLLDDEELNLVIVDSEPVMVPIIEEAIARQKTHLAEGVNALNQKVRNFLARTEGDAALGVIKELEEARFMVSEKRGKQAELTRFIEDIFESAGTVAATSGALAALPSTVAQGFDRPSQKSRDPLHAPENIAIKLRTIESQLSPARLAMLRTMIDARYGTLLETLDEATPRAARTERYVAKRQELEGEREYWRSKIENLVAFRKQIAEAISTLVDIDEDAQEFSTLRQDILDAEKALIRAGEIRSIPGSIARLTADRANFLRKRMLSEGANLHWVSEKYREEILRAHADLATFLEGVSKEWEGVGDTFQPDVAEEQRIKAVQRGGR